MEKPKLNIAVVGTGIMGELYIQVFQADPRTEVTAILCAIDEAVRTGRTVPVEPVMME